MVAQDHRDGDGGSRRPRSRTGATNPSRPSVVSGESVSGGRLSTKRAASLTGFTSFPFALPGWTPTPVERDLQLDRRERLVLDLAHDRPVDGVGEVGAEVLEVEVIGAVADLLVDREGDPRTGPRHLGMREEPRDGGHDLGDAGLVVGAEERRPVRRDDVVADPLGEERARRRREHLRVPGQHDLAAVVVLPDLRVDACRRRVRARVDVGDEADGRPVVAADRPERREDVAVLGQLDVGEPERTELVGQEPREIELLGRARIGLRRRDPTAYRCVRNGGSGRARPRLARRRATIRTGPPRPGVYEPRLLRRAGRRRSACGTRARRACRFAPTSRCVARR